MSTEKEIIRELNIIFKKLGWKLLPEDNKYPDKCWDKAIFYDGLYIDRNYMPYEKYTNKFTIKKLDNYVVEFIKNICLKGELKEIIFGDRVDDNKNCNTIDLK